MDNPTVAPAAALAVARGNLQTRSLRLPRIPRLALILAYAAVFAVASDVYLFRHGAGLRNPYARPERAAVLQAFAEQGGDADILFVGDSRAGHAFMPEIAVAEAKRAGVTLSAFNLSGYSSTVFSDAGVIDYVLSRGARPRLVVWGLGKRQASLMDLPSFQRNEATPALALDLTREAPAWRNICTLGYCATSGARRLLQEPFEYLTEYRRELAAARRNHGIGWAVAVDQWGRHFNDQKMAGAPETPQQWQEAIDKLRQEKNAITPFSDDPSITAALRFLDRRVRDGGGELVLTNMPMLQARTAVERQYGYEAYLAWLRGSADELGAQLIDLNAPSPLLSDRDFKDTDHIGPEAAERVTRELTRTVILPALAAQTRGGEAR